MSTKRFAALFMALAMVFTLMAPAFAFADGELPEEAPVDPCSNGHDYSVPVTRVEPTCTENGTETWKCTNCDDTWEDTIPATGHTWGEWSVTTEPTCTADGEETRECSVCHETETRPVDALGHAFTEFVETVEPTAEAQGYTVYKCSRCDETEKRDFTDYVAPAADPEPPAPVEQFYALTFNVTPKDAEVKVYTWIEPTNEVPKPDYSQEKPLADLDKLAAGIYHYIITAEGYESAEGDVEITDADKELNLELKQVQTRGENPHTHSLTEHPATSATCTTAGNTAYWSCDCGLFFSDDVGTDEVAFESWVIPATGHTWGEWTVTTAPTCTEAGEETRECSVCHATETQPVAALDHDWGAYAVVVPATCVEAGSQTYTCSRCGATENDVIPASGEHTYENGACTVCGAADPDYVAPAADPEEPTEEPKSEETKRDGAKLGIGFNVKTWPLVSDYIHVLDANGNELPKWSSGFGSSEYFVATLAVGDSLSLDYRFVFASFDGDDEVYNGKAAIEAQGYTISLSLNEDWTDDNVVTIANDTITAVAAGNALVCVSDGASGAGYLAVIVSAPAPTVVVDSSTGDVTASIPVGVFTDNATEPVEIAPTSGSNIAVTFNAAAASALANAGTLTLTVEKTAVTSTSITYTVNLTAAGSTPVFTEAAGSAAATVKLPVPDGFTGTVYVKHGNDVIPCTVQGTDGAKYVEVTVAHFSTFTVTQQNDSVVSINEGGNIRYSDDLAYAIANAASGATITLLTNVALTAPTDSTIDIEKNLTINLNGHNIAATGLRVFNVKTGTLEITGSGTISAAAGGDFQNTSSVIRVGDGFKTTDTPKAKAKLIVGSGVTVSSNYCYGITVFGVNTDGMELVMDGTVAVTGAEAAISGNGTSNLSATTMTINGTVTATQDYAIYHPGKGTLTVNGSVTGLGGIEMKGGALTVNSGALVTATATEQTHSANSNGSSTSGYAIAAISNGDYAGNPTVTIIGSVSGKAVKMPDKSTDTDTGVVTAQTNTISLEEGLMWVETTTQGTYEIAQAVASITRNNVTTNYASLAQALANATDGDTVTLLQDVTLSDIVEITHSMTLDGNGRTITTTATRGIWVDTANVTVTIQNLTLVPGPNTERAIQVNESNVTLTIHNVTASATNYTVNVIGGVEGLNLTITDSDLTGWGVVNLWGNNGTVAISNSTLTGVNDKNYNAAGWNNFGVIVVEGDTTGQTTGHASAYDITVTNSTITSTSTNGNTQFTVLYNDQSVNNDITLEGCTVVLNNNCEFLCNNAEDDDESVTKLKNTTVQSTSTIPVLPEGYCYVEDAQGYQVVTKAVAEVYNGGNKVGTYASLADAIAAVPTDGTKTTITMLADSAETGVITVAAGKNVELDLNGKTVSYTVADNAHSIYFITNNGTLEIKDTAAGGAGKVTFLNTNPNTGYSKENVTIYNLGGTFTLTSGIIENQTGYLSYAVNNSSNAWGSPVVSTFTMTGGVLRGAQTDNTLRVYQNSSTTQTSTNIVNISGGSIENGIFVDTYVYQPTAEYTGSNIHTAITISGNADVDGLIDLKVRHPFNTVLNITGGDFDGATLQVRKKADEWSANVAEPTTPYVYISGGDFDFADSNKTFLMAYDSTTSSWTSYEQAYAVSGGTFDAPVPEVFCAEGFIPTEADPDTGKYTVRAANYVAQVGETKYESFAEAWDAANATANSTMTLLADVSLTAQYEATGNFTLDLNGHNINTTHRLRLVKGTLSIINSNTTAPINGEITTTNSGMAPVDVRYDKTNDGTENRTLTIGERVTLVGPCYGLNIFGTNEATTANDIDVTINGTVNGMLFVLGNLSNASNHIDIVLNGTVDASLATGEEAVHTGIAINGNADVVVNNNAVVKGESGIEVRAGSLTVNGGDITATEQTYSVDANSNGCTTKGAAIAVAQHTTKVITAVTVSDSATLTGTKPLSVADPQNNGMEDVTVAVPATLAENVGTVIPAGYMWVESAGVATLGKAVAEINGTQYASLAAAIAAVPADGTATTITMLADEALSSGLTIPAGKNIVLELAGHTVSGILGQAGTTALITNRGTLTIQDNTDTTATGAGTGKLTSAATNPDTGDSPGYASNLITNTGTLFINSGLLESKTNAWAAYAVDNQTNGGLYTPVFTMNGGKLYSQYTDALRMFLNSDTKLNKVVINGGILDSDKASGRVIVVQDSNAKNNKGELDIGGGEIKGTISAWSGTSNYEFGDSQYDAIKIDITGGYIQELDFDDYMTNPTKRLEALVITGGRYANDPSAYLSPEYLASNTQSGTYTYIIGGPYVAKIDTTYYASLTDAIAAAQDGDTITLLTDVTLATPLDVELGTKAITLDLGGKTLTGRTNLRSGNLTIQNGNVAGGSLQALNVYGSNTTAQNYSVLTIANSVTVTADQFGVCLFGKAYNTNGYGAVINIAGTVHTTGNGAEGAVFVSGNLGNNVAGDAHNVINVTGTITSDTDAAIALNGLATVNVQPGASVTGNTAIAVKRGTLNVTGGTITATGAKNYPGTPNYNGTEMTGAAISVTETYNNYGALGVNISGGTITSNYADAVYKKEATYANDANYSISGGQFSSVVPAAFCAEDYIPVQTTNTAGYYTVEVGELEVPTAQYSATLTLKDNIDINFYVKNVPAADASKYTIKYHWADDSDVIQVKLSDYTPVSDGRYKIKVGTIYSYQMWRKVHIEVYFNENQVSINDLHDSIEYCASDYFHNMITKYENMGTQYDPFVTLCKAALTYGAAAQTYFNGRRYVEEGVAYDYVTHANELVNNGINYTSNPTQPDASYRASINGSVSTITRYNASLVLGTETAIKVFLTGPYDLNSIDITCVDDHNEAHRIEDMKLENDGRCSFKVSGIRSYELGRTFTITISIGTETATLKYSPFTYARNFWFTSEIGPLCQALVDYGTAAGNYWN